MSQKTTDPDGRLGVYKQFSDVPERHRLESYHDQYQGRDLWGEFLIEVYFPQHNAYQTQQEARRTGRKWRRVMDERGRHHALARPADVEYLCRELLENVTPLTAYKTYWGKLERFYDWLLWHTEHPHLYNPLLMAANEHEAAGEIWETKMEETL
ncbi:hypothetical protein HWV23_10800 [Natronomonas halophila]|uniref:hypothetical protein n=1 Tax=Natronomonas halophila TaxID=2747817 RepID=UPI0015B638F8|nr:hypothetical protein [Natronomonas halophila]QLD86188.1 hypothetical protein HWV23_10800 [Natronomonas halophila]